MTKMAFENLAQATEHWKKNPPKREELIVGQLKSIIKIIEKEGVEGCSRACWRLADLTFELREFLEAEGYKKLAGLDHPTHRGCMLSKGKRDA